MFDAFSGRNQQNNAFAGEASGEVVEGKKIHIISARKIKSGNGQVLDVESTDSSRSRSKGRFLWIFLHMISKLNKSGLTFFGKDAILIFVYNF